MPTNKILVDSSFLIALYDRSTDEHEAIKEFAHLYSGQFLIPQVVLTEVVYLLKRETGVRGAIYFLDLFTQSQPDLQDIIAPDLIRIQEIMVQYRRCQAGLRGLLHHGAVGTVEHHSGLHPRPTRLQHFSPAPLRLSGNSAINPQTQRALHRTPRLASYQLVTTD